MGALTALESRVCSVLPLVARCKSGQQQTGAAAEEMSERRTVMGQSEGKKEKEREEINRAQTWTDWSSEKREHSSVHCLNLTLSLYRPSPGSVAGKDSDLKPNNAIQMGTHNEARLPIYIYLDRGTCTHLHCAAG